MVDAFLVSFVFGLGVGTFLSPCSVALLPAYVGWYTGLGPDAAPTRWNERFGRGARFASAASLGVFSVFVVVGGLLYALREAFTIPSVFLARGAAVVGFGVALVLILLGILFIVGRAPSFAPRVRAPQGNSVQAMAAFGALFAVASLGCTLPLFFAAVAQMLLVGVAAGLVLLGAFVLGFLGVFFVATVALSLAGDAAAAWLRRLLRYVRPISGAVLVVAGLYVAHYYAIAAPPV